MAEETQELIPLFAEDREMVMINKKISECDENNLFNFITSHFAMFFLDLEELRKFIAFLYDQKGEILIHELLKDFSEIIKEFKQK